MKEKNKNKKVPGNIKVHIKKQFSVKFKFNFGAQTVEVNFFLIS